MTRVSWSSLTGPMQYLHLVSILQVEPRLTFIFLLTNTSRRRLQTGCCRIFQDFKIIVWRIRVKLLQEMHNQVDLKTNADLLLNNNVEREVLTGTGKAYGWSSCWKAKGKLQAGELSWSRTERKIDGINNGSAYPVRQDRPHSWTWLQRITLERDGN